ncbi:thiol reductant ABC exporter subunit CydC [Paralcaligenes ureilyticus]|uniref:ATP-binding cassette subfamily C protein CydC n=1 Tax=Paralcaligenes ureilyticus TaxID=627131 RepID=A0A4R3MFV4_9BURK|nr:thiol reductant ABC exporter subunit CydC [Paralcaligenes ureilyticus]TCT11209.1 ATP-binding cassette subfamily C protein CydC [Paralcaligenes ureilyticus]
MKTLRLLWPWFVQRRRSLAGALLLAILTLAAGMGLLSVAGWFLTAAFLAGASISFDLFAPSALVRGLALLRIVFRYGERVVGHAATLDLLADIRSTVFARIMRLSPGQLAGYQGGDLVARLVGDIDALDTLFLQVIAPILTAVIMGLVFSLVLGAQVHALGWLVFGAMLIGVCVVPYLLARQARAPGSDAQRASAQARTLIHSAIAGHVDLVVFGAQAQAQERFGAAAAQLSRARDRLSAIGSMGQLAQQLASGFCVLALLYGGLQAFTAQEINGPVWVGLLLGALGLFEVLGPLMRGSARLGPAAAAAARVRAVLDEPVALADVAYPLDLPASGVIELSNLSYGYPSMAGVAVLDGIDLQIRAGERLAIVGASGCGKSTLLSLLMRVFDPTQGMVSYGGAPISQVRQAQLHTRFALLSQNSPVFLGTLRSNLLIGCPEADEAQLWRALENARLAEFVRSLENGLDTWVGESGHSLSVGQARRLCLARVLLSPAVVWLLDEPTAGLDEPAQWAFFNDLAAAAEGKTVVLATHAGFPDAAVDRVLRLGQGVLTPA